MRWKWSFQVPEGIQVEEGRWGSPDGYIVLGLFVEIGCQKKLHGFLKSLFKVVEMSSIEP